MTSKPFIIFLFSILYCNACMCQDTTFFDAKWSKTTKSNAFYLSVVTKQGLKWQRADYFEKSGRIQMKGTLSSISPEIRDGYFEFYFENGKLQHKGSYKNGKQDGQHLWYNENGNLEADESFENGTRTGVYEEYFANGKLQDKSSFVNGLQNGWTVYYRENGSKQSEGNFKNNNRDGVWKYYDEGGNLQGVDTIQTEYRLAKANLFFQLPNDEWHLAVNEAPAHYVFKRNAVTDSSGRQVIPAIMVYAGDAEKYNQDIVLYSEDKLKPFTTRGLEILQTLTWSDSDYPLSYKNALFKRAEYTQNGVRHILYIVHIINKQNVGIQVYLDMTKEISEKYGPEFWTTIRSIKEIN